jgi:hypothetical protein
MAEITIKVNNSAYERARRMAEHTGKPIEDILANWTNLYGDESSMESLSDAEILKIADSMLSHHQQSELNALLALNTEEQISEKQLIRLDELMEIYHQLLVRKAEAIAIAVERGLREPLAS